MDQDSLNKQFTSLHESQRELISTDVSAITDGVKFIPNPGPQTEAYFSPADILLFGGSAGCGKSGLINGLALTQHDRSLILRRQYADLGGITDDLIRLYGTRDGFISMPRPRLRTTDGRTIDFGACQHPGDEESMQGQPRDFYGFDEVTQFLEHQVRYIIGWNRTIKEGQRCRVVFASNPPTSSDGDWIIGYFRPWLDPTYHKPAKSGELRWVVTDPDGKDMWVDGPNKIKFPGRPESVTPKSRTFIPGKLSDNPYLVRTGYASTLDSLPEPMRSAMRDGNFMLSRQDDAFQAIPSAWVKEAMARWHKSSPNGVPMCAIGVDVACGGKDETILAVRYDGWYDKLICVPGERTKEGSDIAALVVKHRRDGASVILDMGGGYGGAPREQLAANGIIVTPYKGAEKSSGKSTEDKLGYTNKRSEAWWKFRKALDPSQPGGSTIALPDDPKLLADLTAPTFSVVSGGIKVEPKEKVNERLGRSTDRGDAVVMAWYDGPRGMVHTHPAQQGSRQKFVPKVVRGYENRKKKR